MCSTEFKTKCYEIIFQEGLAAVIKLKNQHSHTTDTADALSHLRPGSELRSAFELYFSSGLSLSEAIKFHESKLELAEDFSADTLANAIKILYTELSDIGIVNGS